MNNTVRINAEEQKYWNSDSADYWVSQKPALDRLLAPWARLLLEAAELSGGEQIADIGCGTGATTLKFAASVGAGGRIIGIDLSRKLIDSAIKSARERAIENVMFVEADAAEYRFPCPQDLIISRCGVMFFGDLVAAFSNLRSGLARTGRILLVVWRAPEQNEWYQFPVRCAAAFSDQQPEHDPDVAGGVHTGRSIQSQTNSRISRIPKHPVAGSHREAVCGPDSEIGCRHVHGDGYDSKFTGSCGRRVTG